jgi:hypothetical protein
VAQKLGHPKENKKKCPKAFIMFLEAHQSFLRKILRYSETASANTTE